MEKSTVAVLFGGLSSEKEISLATGRYVYSIVDRNRYNVLPLYMSSSNGKLYILPDKLVIQNRTEDIENRLSEAEYVKLESLKSKCDLVFIALLGKYGEDGVIQGILEILGIPYTGSGILPSAVAMHKRVTKNLLRSMNITVARDYILSNDEWQNNQEKVINEIQSQIGMPVVVKPTREGSSVGVSFANDIETLKKGISLAFEWDKEILVEEYVKGQEFMCIVIGNQNPVAMIPTEAEFTGEIFTYDGKYMPGRARYHTPPRDCPPERIQQIRDIAIKAYQAIGVKGFGRVDGFITEDKIVIGEVHTGTIMVPSSYVFQQASRADFGVGKIKGINGKNKGIKGVKGGSGFSPRTLVTTFIDLAIDAHYNKKGTLI